MDKAEHFRRRAAEMEQEAALVANPRLRARFLELAREYLEAAAGRERDLPALETAA